MGFLVKSVREYVDDLGLTFSDFVEGLRLDEKTYKDLRRDAPNFLNIRGKSKKTPGTDYKGIEEDVLIFESPSYTKPGVSYTQKIRLVALNDLIANNDGSKKPIDIVRTALEGDIEVHCTDPSWLYWGFKYIGTRDRYAIEPEPRFPKVRNPQLKGSVCKHLDNVLLVLPFWASEITRDLRKQRRL